MFGDYYLLRNHFLRRQNVGTNESFAISIAFVDLLVFYEDRLQQYGMQETYFRPDDPSLSHMVGMAPKGNAKVPS
jgi:hypothetical protein